MNQHDQNEIKRTETKRKKEIIIKMKKSEKNTTIRRLTHATRSEFTIKVFSFCLRCLVAIPQSTEAYHNKKEKEIFCFRGKFVFFFADRIEKHC